MSSEAPEKIRNALRAHDHPKPKQALDCLNTREKQDAIRKARSTVVDEMNAALAAQIGGAAIDTSAFMAELDALDTLLSTV